MKKLISLLGIIIWFWGCSSIKPDIAYASYTHQSQPFQGSFIPPFGDNGHSDETNFDGLEAGVRWENGPLFSEASVTYLLRDSGIAGGPWVTSFRLGAKVKL